MSSLYFRTGGCLALLYLLAIPANLRAQCTLGCDAQINVALDNTCSAVIAYTAVLTSPDPCTPGGAANYEVTVMNAANTAPLPTSPAVTGAQIGQLLPVKVRHLPSNNSCWGTVRVLDEIGPALSCPADVTVACTSATGQSITGTPGVSDCSGATLTSFDEVVTDDCGVFLRTITRTFIATDGLGNGSSCVQTINVAAPQPGSVTFPTDLDGLSNPALACGPNVSTDPATTGRPTVGGAVIVNGGGCPLVTNFTDELVPLCSGSFQIFRTWTVVEWCTGTVLSDVQVIKVQDTTPPVITPVADITVGMSNGQTCTGGGTLPALPVSDNCSANVSVSVLTPVGILNTNGGAISGLDLGTHTVTYFAQDACGNLAVYNLDVTVVDDHVPTMVCDEITTVTLGADGTAEVPALTFDDGSFDNCCPLTYEVRRMSPGCGSTTAFGPSVLVCCDDINQNTQVELRATDCFGNSNSCMVTLLVEDKTTPTLSCPADVTLTCTQALDDPALVGTATASDGCGAIVPVVSSIDNFNNCNLGTRTRTFTATDAQGNAVQCSQTITVIDDTPFSVDWPADYTVDGCADVASLEPDSLPAGFDRPVFVGTDCELLAVSHTDELITVAAPACFKLVRTWEVINWCTFSANGAGLPPLTYQQIIKVNDTEAPNFTCPADLSASTDAASCTATITLPEISDATDCSADLDIAVSGDLGSGTGPFVGVAPGSYTATYTVSDNCGNTSTCTISITVEDLSAPTPICQNGLIVDLDQNGEAAVWASDLDLSTVDPCGGPVDFAFSADPSDTGRVFTCTELGLNPVALYVFDAAGNSAFCSTFIQIQDNVTPCTPPAGALGGMIQTDMGAAVEAVSVQVSGANGGTAMSDATGAYVFPALPLDDDYTLAPSKSNDPLNGVTTYDIVLLQRHILGAELLPNPYRIIAADVNLSGDLTVLDIVDMRRAILYLTNGFAVAPSWRFVDGSYTFTDPANPLDEAWPEVRNVNNFDGDLSTVNFVAVKMGDLNATAQPNAQAPPVVTGRGAAFALHTDERSVRAGETLSVPVYANEALTLAALQLTLDLGEALELRHIRAGQLDISPTDYHTLIPAVVPLAYAAETAIRIDPALPLFTLQLQAKNNGQLATQLDLSARYTPALVYPSDDSTGRRIELHYQRALEQARALPNPFGEATTLQFSLVKQQQISLTLYDALGRRIRTETRSLAAGTHDWRLDRKTLPRSGTYTYHLRGMDYRAAGRLVVID